MGQFLAEAALWIPASILAAAALAIAFAGVRLSGVANMLADRTGMGEIMAGALFVGAATSLPDLVTSASAALQDRPNLAIGNALGGLTVQIAFLAIADLVYRKANIEHAAASVAGLAQAALLVALLALPLLAANAPEVAILGVHPASVVLPVAYGCGLWLLHGVHERPMWSPVMTKATQAEEVGGEDAEQGAPEAEDPATRAYRETSTRRLWLMFGVYGLMLGASGYAVAESGIALVEATGLSETAVGTVFTAIATSLGELVTAIAAVRAGAVSLAVGNVIGGNCYDVLLLAVSDVFYRGGSLYHRFSTDDFFTASMALLMTAVLLLGLLYRERRGVGAMGSESALVLVLYAVSVAMVFF